MTVVTIPGLTADLVDRSVEQNISRIDLRRVVSLLNKLAVMNDQAIAGIALGPEDYEEFLSIRDGLLQLIAPVACCSSGCSSCCHMAVTISTADAALIGNRLGIKPEAPAMVLSRDSEVKKYLNVPCPFLKGGKCSIYEVRPTACRTHFNISRFPALCDTVQHPGHEVPNFDFTAVWSLSAFFAYVRGETLADIREFFPEGPNPIQSL